VDSIECQVDFMVGAELNNDKNNLPYEKIRAKLNSGLSNPPYEKSGTKLYNDIINLPSENYCLVM